MPTRCGCSGCGRTRGSRPRRNSPMRRFALLLGLLLPCVAGAQSTPHRQSAAVLAHYPAIAGMKLDSPAFRTAEPSLTSQDSMQQFLAALALDSGKVKVASLGKSTQGRDIPVVYL